MVSENGRLKLWGHIRCGWHSGIPFCCILFFIFVWQPIFWLRYFIFEDQGPIARQLKRFISYWPPNNERYQYVACPLCVLRGKQVEIRRCTHTAKPGCCRHA